MYSAESVSWCLFVFDIERVARVIDVIRVRVSIRIDRGHFVVTFVTHQVMTRARANAIANDTALCIPILSS